MRRSLALASLLAALAFGLPGPAAVAADGCLESWGGKLGHVLGCLQRNGNTIVAAGSSTPRPGGAGGCTKVEFQLLGPNELVPTRATHTCSGGALNMRFAIFAQGRPGGWIHRVCVSFTAGGSECVPGGTLTV